MISHTLTPKIQRLDAGEDPTYGKFVVEPLEQGYGATLGNSLRRVLLSSIPGAAITAVTIDGALHEFATIPGVVEDITEIMLNLKLLAVRILDRPVGSATGDQPEQTEGPRILRMERRGQGEVLAADIETPADVEIANPELHLATLNTDDAFLSMEIEVDRGTGYMSAEEQRGQRRRPIGAIPIDAIFSPVRRVSWKVEPTRVGQLTELDRLVLEVHTNGTISPAEALSEGAKFLDRYLILFFDFYEQEGGLTLETATHGDRVHLLDTRIEDLNFSVRVLNCLRREGIATLAHLLQHTEEDLMAIRNFGSNSLVEVKEQLNELGLTIPSRSEGADAAADTESEAETA